MSKWKKLQHNEIINGVDYHMSYNPNVKESVWDKLAEDLVGKNERKQAGAETALCYKDPKGFAGQKWIVLHGDHRKIVENVKSKKEAIAIFTRLQKKHGSMYSTNNL